MLNPLYTIQLMMSVSTNDIIYKLDNVTKDRFCLWCVVYANANEDNNIVKAQASETFKWWNPGTP